MLLEGEEHSSVKNCKRLDPGLNCCLVMTGGPFSFLSFFFSVFFFPPAAPSPHLPHIAGSALLQIPRVALLGPLKLPPVYLSLLFEMVERDGYFLS